MTSLLNEIELAARNSPSMRVLVIEDDQETASFLRRALKEQGHVAEYAADGQTGLELARANAYDVLIVDRMLPKCDGLTVIGSLRAEEIRTPALILSALGEVDDRVKGLRAGGDDYLTKPYAFSELLARIEALARRTSPEEGSTRFVVGDLVLDRLSHKVTRAGEPIILQPRERRPGGLNRQPDAGTCSVVPARRPVLLRQLAHDQPVRVVDGLTQLVVLDGAVERSRPAGAADVGHHARVVRVAVEPLVGHLAGGA